MNDYFSIVDEFSLEEIDSSSGESSGSYSSFSFDAYGDTSGTQGNDYIENYDDNVAIEAYGGNDTVNNYGSFVTINGGAGNDLISLGAETKNNLIQYTEGGGNDTIQGFKVTDTLQIGDATGTYSTQTSGKDIIVTVGEGSITLTGAANLSNVNIVGNEIFTEPVWTLNGTTATYGTPKETLITVSGVKSVDGLSLNGSTVTVANSALNSSNVTISNGYTLALADGVTTSTTTKAGWSIKKTTATYKSASTTAGYTLASDAKSISYSDEKAATSLVTVTGVKSLDGLSLRKKVVTVGAASLGTKNVTISNGYTLKLGSDVTAPTTNDAEWKLDGTTAIYMGESATAGYTLADNTITYSKATTATALASIEGAKAVDGLTVSGKTIKTTATALSSNVSVGSDDYGFEFVSGYKSAQITGIGGDDTIKTAGQKVTVDSGAGNDSIVSSGKYSFIEGGAGNDFITATGAGATIEGGKGNDTLTGGTGANVFVYANGDGKDVITNYNEQDKISITSGAANISTNGDDVIFTIGKGSITVKDAVSKVITYYDASGNELVYPKPEEKVEYNSAGTLASLPASYSADGFTPTEYKDYADTLKTIDASAVEHDLKITGNKQANEIIGSGQDDFIDGGRGADVLYGGAGNDTLYGNVGNDKLFGGKGNDSLSGGTGSDIFVYNNGDGNDVISDYSEDDGDKIQIASGTISSITTSKTNVIFTVGKGKLTVQNASEQLVTYIDSTGEEKIYTNKPVIYNEAGTTATLTDRYTDDEFAPNNYKAYRSTLATIDASAVQSDLKITANKKANNITGSTQDDFIDGAAGADVIYGGAGADTLYGNAGNDKLFGGKDNDSLSGGTGADIFVYNNGDGNDVIEDYEEGVDKIQIASGSITSITPSKKNLILKVGKGQITINNAAEKEITVIDAKGQESVINVRKVVYNDAGTTATLTDRYTDDQFTPTEYVDVRSTLLTIDASAVKNDLKIVANKKANSITGSTQDDFVDGAAGADVIYGGTGADTLYGNAGNDKLFGEVGNDSLSGGAGADTLEGGAGADKLTGGAGADLFVYNNDDGNDLITDYSEKDGDKIQIASGTISTITTSKKNVIFTVGKGKLTVSGAADQLVTYIDADGDEKVYTNKKVIYNEAGTSATLTERYTDDEFAPNNYKAYRSTLATIDASAVQSDLKITANKKANSITGSGQDDFIDGAAGADVIYGGIGNDTLYGNAGNDKLFGEVGNDSLNGGAGADTLEGGKGADKLFGGAGADLFVYKNGDGNDVIEDFNGDDGDKLQVASGSISKIVNSKNDVVFTVGKGKITLKNAINEVVTYMDSTGEESVYTGNQIVYNEGYTAVTLKANYNDDEFVPSNYSDHNKTLATINAAAVEHDLKITANKKANHITGSGQDDTIDAAAGADKLYGGVGNDSLFGGAGNDLLDGGAGNDTLWGGVGTDTLTGGDGRDTFIYNAGEGSKTITDYAPKLDTVIVNGNVKGYAANKSGNVIFTMSDGAKLTFTDCVDKAVVLQNSSGKTIKNGAYYGG